MEFKILKESRKIPSGAHGESIVLEELKKADRVEYVTHLKLYHSGQEPFTAYGHYFADRARAEKDFDERVKELRRY